MRRIVLICFIVGGVFWGCATHSTYDTAQVREREYITTQITINNEGLSVEQIQSILATQPPGEFPVDIALMVLKDGYISNELEQLFVSQAIQTLKASPSIERVVPIPKFLVPAQINFATIQELGIRTLCEYVVVFVLDSEQFFTWTKIIETRYELTSAVDFLLIDAQTTAILSSDRLFSTKTYEKNLFELGEEKKVQMEIFAEQGTLLGEKIARLFAD